MSQPANEHLKTIPLEHYHCTFFLPLIPTLGKEILFEPNTPEYFYGSTSNSEEREEAEAYHFFTPILREILFNRSNPQNEQNPAATQNKLQPLREWRLAKETFADWQLTLKSIPDKNIPDKIVTFDSVRLYRYFNGLYILAYTVKPAAGQIMALEDWLHFTRLGRQLYPTFAEQRVENKLAPLILSGMTGKEPVPAFDKHIDDIALPPLDKPGAAISPIIKELLKAFYSLDTQAELNTWLDECLALYDDRMFVSVAYGFADNTLLNLDKDDLARIKALVAFTDRFSDTTGFSDKQKETLKGYPYSKTTIDRYLEQAYFDLWADIGASYVYTDVVNAYLSDGWFFNNIVATKHIPYIYDRMLLQALFYQASLRHYDHQITQKTSLLMQQGADAIDEILQQRSDFIQFTNQYWFKEVTNQMQGKEIFRLQQRGLGLENYYSDLQDEIERTNDYLQVLYDKRQAEADNAASQRGERLANWGMLLASLVLFSAIADGVTVWHWVSCQLDGQEAIAACQGGEKGWVVTILFVVAILFPVYIIINWIKNKL